MGQSEKAEKENWRFRRLRLRQEKSANDHAFLIIFASVSEYRDILPYIWHIAVVVRNWHIPFRRIFAALFNPRYCEVSDTLYVFPVGKRGYMQQYPESCTCQADAPC